MSETIGHLKNAPIVEAVLDLDCDVPPGLDLAALEAGARSVFADRYPTVRKRMFQEHTIETTPGDKPAVSSRASLDALQFVQQDERQLVQVRGQGFSFNRLAPYSSLDDYLTEIERTWRLYVSLAGPLNVRVIRLRYINRIQLPLDDGKVDLDHYFRFGPRVLADNQLSVRGFLNQYAAVDVTSGHHVNLVLAAQAPEGAVLPVILDITVAAAETGDPGNWSWIGEKTASLRILKNKVFRSTLGEACLQLFK